MRNTDEQIWDRYLTSLELDYTYAAERRIRPDTVEAPSCPLPEQLKDRAAHLVRLQKQLLEELLEEQAGVQKQMNAVKAVPTEHVRPVYLDVTG